MYDLILYYQVKALPDCSLTPKAEEIGSPTAASTVPSDELTAWTQKGLDGSPDVRRVQSSPELVLVYKKPPFLDTAMSLVPLELMATLTQSEAAKQVYINYKRTYDVISVWIL